MRSNIRVWVPSALFWLFSKEVKLWSITVFYKYEVISFCEKIYYFAKYFMTEANSQGRLLFITYSTK